jgi:hypothetical protein
MEATLGLHTPFDATSPEYESNMKSLAKEELQKNEGDLPEDRSCWLKQQSTAVQIECMEGLGQLARLHKEELQQVHCAQKSQEIPGVKYPVGNTRCILWCIPTFGIFLALFGA